jgi:hypothetical protein
MLLARQGWGERSARATYLRNVSVALLLSASESAAAPASPITQYSSIRRLYRLQRGEEGQGCSWRDRAAGTEQGARDLLERRQQAQCIRKLITIAPPPPDFEHSKHNFTGAQGEPGGRRGAGPLGVHLCAAPNAASSVRLLKNFSLERRRRFQRRFTRSSLFPSFA